MGYLENNPEHDKVSPHMLPEVSPEVSPEITDTGVGRIPGHLRSPEVEAISPTTGKPLTQVEIEGVGTIAVGPDGETLIDHDKLVKLLKLGEEEIALVSDAVRNAAQQVRESYDHHPPDFARKDQSNEDLSELESRLKELAPMVEAMHATEGQLPPEKRDQLLERIAENALERRLKELAPMVEAVQATEGQLPPEKMELLLKRIAEGAAKRRLQARDEALWKELASAIARVPVALRKEWAKLPELLDKLPDPQSWLRAHLQTFDESVAAHASPCAPPTPAYVAPLAEGIPRRKVQLRMVRFLFTGPLLILAGAAGLVWMIGWLWMIGVLGGIGLLWLCSRLISPPRTAAESPVVARKLNIILSPSEVRLPSHVELEELMEKSLQSLPPNVKDALRVNLIKLPELLKNTPDARLRWEALLEIGEPSESSDSKLEEKIDLPIEHQEFVEAAFSGYHTDPASITMRCHDCSARFQPEDVKWVATHPSLKGDPILGQEAFLRFFPSGPCPEGVLDAKGSACTQTACPKCHQILQYESVATLTENPYAPA